MKEQDKESYHLGKTTILLITVLIVFIWGGAWGLAAVKPHSLQELTTQPLADIFSSVNALFAGLACAGVIITIYLQMRDIKQTADDLKKTAEANAKTAEAVGKTAEANGLMADASLKMVTHYNERSVLDMFQVYCSDYFQGVKDSSMSVLIPCVASKKYFDYVISRFFVANQQPFPQDCWERVSNVSYCNSYEEFVSQEQRYRYKLDELINFFTVLTGRENSRDIIKRCDFSYSWWRPLFWMIASQQKKRYETNETVRKFATPLYFPDVVKELDAIYGFTPFLNDQQMWEFIVNHPKIISYGLDPAHCQLPGRDQPTVEYQSS